MIDQKHLDFSKITLILILRITMTCHLIYLLITVIYWQQKLSHMIKHSSTYKMAFNINR